MSVKDRAERAANARDCRRKAAELEGMRQALSAPDGRALIFWFIQAGIKAEGKGSRQLRELGRDVLRAAQVADWDGLQIMREEWEKPGTRVEAEEEEGEE